MSNSFMLSADNAHAVHPNHPEYADAQNKPRINGGIVLKFNAAQRYATDGVGGAIFRRVCEQVNAGVQSYANRSDMPGGSTLGNIANTRVNVHTVDIGLAQLAMHSAYETAGTEDLEAYVRACKAFYHTAIQCVGDDSFTLEYAE
jgi:aspartyl aminopeptidase